MKTPAKIITILAVSLAGVFLLHQAHAATIGFDQQSNLQNVNLTNVNLTVNVTSSQSNLLLVMKIFGSKATTLGVSSVVYDGLSLTQLVATSTPTPNSSTWSIWYLVNPPTGSHNSTTTFSASASAFFICAESYYNVNQITPFDASGSAYVNLGTSVSTTLTTQNANDVITSFAADNGPAGSGIINPAPGTGDITTCGANTGGLHAGAAYRYIPTAQTTSTQWIQGTSTWYGMAAGSIVPFIAPTSQADVTFSSGVTVSGGVTIQ